MRAAVAAALESPGAFRSAARALLGCATPAGAARLRDSVRSIGAGRALDAHYPAWRARHFERRRERYGRLEAPGLLSLVTTVFDTDPRWIAALARSVRSQSLADYEWIVLENGSTRAATREAVAKLGEDHRVRLLSASSNLGIIGGMRKGLLAATGRYVVPVDSDDVLAPDALLILAHHLRDADFPRLAYSDEDKIDERGVPQQPFFKPAWDPVRFWSSCYIAHLCAVDRCLAIALGVYTDVHAEGCHDWDTFFRFLQAGETPSHVPEILYSWRRHSGSCAGDIHQKSYIDRSHVHVLTRNLRQGGLGDRFDVVRSPLQPKSPDWRIRPRDHGSQKILICHDASGPLAAPRLRDPGAGASHPIHTPGELFRLCEASESSGSGVALVAVVCGIAAFSPEWVAEALGVFERFPSTSLVGGRVVTPRGRTWCAGRHLDGSGTLTSPHRGAGSRAPGYFAEALKQRTVDSVSGHLLFTTVSFIAWCGPPPSALPLSLLADWLACRGIEVGRRCVYTPYIAARLRAEPAAEAPSSAELCRARPAALEHRVNGYRSAATVLAGLAGPR